jgi:hypothetical protein
MQHESSARIKRALWEVLSMYISSALNLVLVRSLAVRINVQKKTDVYKTRLPAQTGGTNCLM